LTGKGSISPETINRVKTAAAELNYLPNLAARAMRTQTSNNLAIVTGLHDHDAGPVLAGATEEATKAGYLPEVYSFELEDSRDNRILELASSGQVVGILCFTAISDDLLQRVRGYVPVIRPDTLSPEMFNVGQLADAAPIAAFVTKLAEGGYRRFLHIGGPVDSVSAAGRKVAFADVIEQLGLESLGIIDGDWSAESGLTAVNELDEAALPVAVIAGNDRVAVGVMRGAHLRGWRIPEDIVVTGWNNSDISGYLNPPLPTVDVDRIEAGRWEMRRLIAAINGSTEPTPLKSLSSIVWRGLDSLPTPLAA
jgi:DNA-binding LacI/PurR family transcriptional regulator